MSECARIRGMLDGWLDGDLTQAGRVAVEQHLERCGACAAEASALAAIVAAARDLPREIAPDRDLWPVVASRLVGGTPGAPRRPRAVPGAWLLAAAAVVLVAVGVVIGTAVGRGDAVGVGGKTVFPGERGTISTAADELGPGQADLEHAAADLHAALDRRRGRLARPTMKLLDDNLRIIDDAIARIRAALDDDPGNRELVILLASTYQRKIDLLATAVSVSQRS